jgi:thiamine-phosphate diphosphorylase
VARRPVPPLHVVTDDEVAARPGFVELATRIVGAGGDLLALHIRLPASTGRVVYDLARALRPACRTSGAALIVNDRVDVAAAVDAEGAHLGRRSLDPVDARAILGPGRLVGSSVTTRAEGDYAAQGRSDYLFVGSIYPTASHPGRQEVGVGRIAEMAGFDLPLVAIGGITVDRVALVRSAGAAGVAVIRGVWDADDPAEAVRQYLDALS